MGAAKSDYSVKGVAQKPLLITGGGGGGVVRDNKFRTRDFPFCSHPIPCN